MKHNSTRGGLLALLVLSVFFSAQPKPALAATLVEKGKARAVIILPEKPSPIAERASRVLRDHIKET